MTHRIQAACSTNIGKVRRKNEDNLFFADRILEQEHKNLHEAYIVELSTESMAAFAVFDGMGGEAHGEIASYIAAETLQMYKEQKNNFIVSVKNYLNHYVLSANKKVFEKSVELDRCYMGSTVAMLVFYKNVVYLCNLGDSKIFRLRRKCFTQISVDHTDEEILRKNGVLNRKPRLTQHLGIDPLEMRIEPYIAKGEVEFGDRYLICSDGLTDMLSNSEITGILIEYRDTESCVNELITRAVAKGGRDNITVILLDIS